MNSQEQLSLDSAATAALIAYYQAISNPEKFSPRNVQLRLDKVASFGIEAEMRAHQLHLEYLTEHPIPKPENRRKITLRRTDRLITKRHNLRKKAKEEIARLTADLWPEPTNVYVKSQEMQKNY